MNSYLQEWNKMFQDQQSQQQHLADINLYYELETAAYKKILANPKNVWQGKFTDLQKQLGFQHKPVIFTGFLEGMKDSLNHPLNLEDIDDDSEIVLDIDFQKLFLAMHDAKADWLYSIKDWDEIISPEKQRQLLFDWRQTKMAHTDKIGRNDPCPCGSGKKYKKCCGK